MRISTAILAESVMFKCIVSTMMVLITGKMPAYDDCVFDMMNIFLRARSFDPANWKKGYVVKFPIVDGNGRTPAQIKFVGKETIKADNGVKYRCLRLAYHGV